MKLVIASYNQDKVAELSEMLAPYFDEIYSLEDLDINVELEEVGVTFQENAKHKAIEIAKITGCNVLADDSGLVVDALGGAPGVFSARYFKHGDDSGNVNKLLNKMQGVREEKRTARFVCSLAISFNETQTVTIATGVCEGYITEKPIGKYGFGYDPVFYYPQMKCTFSEMTDEEKNKISHRHNAIQNLLKHLDKSEDGIQLALQI